MIAADTNVVSELMRPAPDEAVRGWVLAQRPAALVTTAVTLAEIGYGIARLPAGGRREILADVASTVFGAFAEAVLAFDAEAARAYAEIVSTRERAGRPIDVSHAQIASICRTRGATLATRNGRDFQGTGIEVVDPWA